MGCFKGI